MTQDTNTMAVDGGAFQEEGIAVDLGFGRHLRFFPLTWGALRRMRKDWNTLFGADSASAASPEWQDAAARILLASARRGQPDLTEDAFLDMLDTRNASKCFDALAAVSGMRRVSQGPGETAVRPTVSPSGAPSTQSSSPTPAGLSQSAMN
jgi:hypothetical protein